MSASTGARGMVLGAVTLLLVGCGGPRRLTEMDAGVRGPADGWLVFDAAMITHDAGLGDGGHGDGGHDGGADAGCVGAMSGTVLTNQPTVTFVDDGDGTMPLVGATFFDAYHGIDAFIWIGEVRNMQTHVVCPSFLVDVSGSMRDAAITASPHWQPGGSTVNSCADPGETFVAYDVTSISIATAVARGTVHYRGYAFIPSVQPPRDPAAPTATVAAMYDPSLRWWNATGTLTNGSQDIHNIELAIYPRDACGLLTDNVPYFHLDGFSAFSSESYTTRTGAQFDFHSQLVFVDYLRGL